jgi:hypothetical protein
VKIGVAGRGCDAPEVVDPEGKVEAGKIHRLLAI